MRTACVLTLFACLMAGSVSAEDVYSDDLTPLLGDALKGAFENITMDGIYKAPRQRSGTDRFTETFLSNGTTRYREGSVFDIGEWATSHDTICFAYTGALGNRMSCFNVFQKGQCYYSYLKADVKNGIPINANSWTAKTVVQGQDLACDDLVG